jgi:hypothetical protein
MQCGIIRGMKTKDIINIGQMVFVGNKDKREIKGEITAVCIRETSTKYEVTWWKDDNRKSEWVHESELSIYGKKQSSKLGFGS